MATRRETYKGHTILIREHPTDATTMRTAADTEPELYIDDEPVYTVRNRAGRYLASGLAYDPQDSLEDLGKRIIDDRSAADDR